MRGQLRFLRRNDAPAARGIDIYVENAKLTTELAAFGRAALGAKAENGSDIAKNFNLNVRGVDELVGVAGSLNETNLLRLADDFTVPGDAGKIVAEDGVEDSGIVELNGAGKALFEIGDGLTVSLLIRLNLLFLG